MKEHSVPIAHLVFPVLLPLAEGKLLEEFVGGDDEHRGCSLKSHAALDTDNGVAHVHIAADAILGTYRFNCLNGSNFIFIIFPVDRTELAILEAQG